MTRNVSTLVAVLACALLLAPTAAVPVDNTGTTAVPLDDVVGPADAIDDDTVDPVDFTDDDQVDPVNDEETVLLVPADGPNGMYVEFRDGELSLDLAGVGVNDNSLTAIDGIFEIVHVGETNATVYLDSGVEDVYFYQGTDTEDSLEGPSNNVTLGQNDQIAVGLAIDTREPDHDVESMETFSVHANTVDEGTPAPEPTETPTPEPTSTPTSDSTTPSPAGETPPTDGETPTPTPEGTPALTPALEETATPTPDSGEEDNDTAILDAGTTEDDGTGPLSNTVLTLVLLGVVTGGAAYAARKQLAPSG